MTATSAAFDARFVASYHDAGASCAEAATVLARSWVNTGPVSDIPDAGDARPLEVAGLPIIAVRGEDGQVRTFHNVCRHRGARVLRAPCRGERLLRCAYHGWAYGLRGELRGAPRWNPEDDTAPAGFAVGDFGLEPVRCAVWLGQLFVNVDGNAPPFDEFVAPLETRWANYDLGRLVPATRRRLDVDANWKFAVENFLDTYHLPSVHPQLGDMEAAFRFTDVDLPDCAVGICYTTGAADKPKSSGKPLRRFERLSASQSVSQDILALYPNTLIELQPTHLMLVAVVPSGPATCIEHLEFSFLDDDAVDPALAQERERVAEAWCEIMAQDLLVLRDLQAAAHSPAARRVATMSPAWEQATFRFREHVAGGLLRAGGPG